MAKHSAPAVAPPNYGEHKAQVIDFLRELLMKGHKPESAIGIWPKEGAKRLGIRCVRCYQHIIVPVDGEIHIYYCDSPRGEKGGA